MGRRVTGGVVVVVALAVFGACTSQRDFQARALTRDTAPLATVPTTVATTVPPTTTPPTAPPTTAPPAPPPAPPAPTRALAGVHQVAGIDAYRGLATWIDVYDWTREFTRGGALVGPGDVDAMADRGAQTLYVQTSKWDSPNDVVDPDLLMPIIQRAHARGLKVVAWYLPTLEDLPADFRRLVAASRLGVDSIAVDIESRKVSNLAERNRRLVVLSDALRKALPGRAIGGIVLPPVVLDVVNPHYWPSFPWRAIAPYYDVWLPMGYWTNRTASSGYRDSYRYADENITRLRQHLALPSATVHYVGGIADRTTPADVDGMNRVIAHHGAIGGSLYDWRTTAPGLWPYLQPLRWKP